MITTSTTQAGFYWHVHHNELMEWCYDYQERVYYIRREKPAHEIDTRLRLFQPVRGELPQNLAQARQTLDQAWQTYQQALQTYQQAAQTFWQARQTFEQALQTFEQALQTYKQAWQTYQQAEQTYLPELVALHAQECPDCPWNGRTIFPKS